MKAKLNALERHTKSGTWVGIVLKLVVSERSVKDCEEDKISLNEMFFTGVFTPSTLKQMKLKTVRRMYNFEWALDEKDKVTLQLLDQFSDKASQPDQIWQVDGYGF